MTVTVEGNIVVVTVSELEFDGLESYYRVPRLAASKRLKLRATDVFILGSDRDKDGLVVLSFASKRTWAKLTRQQQIAFVDLMRTAELAPL